MGSQSNLSWGLPDFVAAFARGIRAVDAKRPQARGRGQRLFAPGIGPHTEDDTVRLVMQELMVIEPERYHGSRLGVAYPDDSRSKEYK